MSRTARNGLVLAGILSVMLCGYCMLPFIRVRLAVAQLERDPEGFMDNPVHCRVLLENPSLSVPRLLALVEEYDPMPRVMEGKEGSELACLRVMSRIRDPRVSLKLNQLLRARNPRARVDAARCVFEYCADESALLDTAIKVASSEPDVRDRCLSLSVYMHKTWPSLRRDEKKWRRHVIWDVIATQPDVVAEQMLECMDCHSLGECAPESKIEFAILHNFLMSRINMGVSSRSRQSVYVGTQLMSHILDVESRPESLEDWMSWLRLHEHDLKWDAAIGRAVVCK